MKNTVKVLVTSFVLFSALHAVAQAAEPSKNLSVSRASVSDQESNRDVRRIGAYLGILGDPHPTGIGFNVAYNALSFLRASVGFGKISTGASISMDGAGTIATAEESQTTIGAAAKFMVPGWNLTPAVTVGYSHISVTEGMFTLSEYKSNNIYTGIGVDWQADFGLNLGAGMNLSLNSGAPSAPYINVGYFL
jgi:hypothetical protein